MCAATLLLLLLLLLLKLLVPIGYMVATDHGRVTIAICPGVGSWA